ncbi:DNA helicase IV [Mixta intestinalis]|uniref:DNA 3'-5' helicase n=1 Tax=Mixta intestinalis TaxID=1615494 RepID=A0A6P1PVI7_9GAMM|nr:DNA helicase IV [Mixta intestinalis]QHM70526.1 DNA helicase IV [Mixta intestinalis]
MELKATSLGKHLAQHPYNRVRLLSAGVEVSGEKHEYLIPFNQLLEIQCKRGLIWGELEFTLPDNKVVRLHGTEWQETQRFYHYLSQAWQQWSAEMSEISAQVLQQLVDELLRTAAQDRWLKRNELAERQAQIEDTFSALPLPAVRLDDFENCRSLYQQCLHWLHKGEATLANHNQAWTERMLQQYADFFSSVEKTPLNSSQARAVVNGEETLLVLAGAGSGKTSVLVARAGWLLLRQQAQPQQILLLSFGRQAAQEMNERIKARLHNNDIEARTFHALALHIIHEGSKKRPVISRLETDSTARRQLLIETWRQQCAGKKAHASGWRQWLTDELAWTVPEGDFWQDEMLTQRLVSRLEQWLGLMRIHGGAQAAMIADAPEAVRDRFAKRIKLMAPLMKAWKTALKEEGAVDFSGLIHQAVNLLEKGRFISPWKHILVDEFQDISPQRAALLSALRKQNRQTTLFAVGDDWQAVYRFSGAEMNLINRFHHHFGSGDSCVLDTTYRFNDRIGDIANRFILENPHQLAKPLNSLTKGGKKAISLLPDDRLEDLLNKISGYALLDERVLLLARYYHLQPDLLAKAKTRWPKLNLDFMTIHASKGQQADYVILLGLHEGSDGFPAAQRETVIEEGLLPEPEDFPDAEERRLAYVALTRAKQQVWLLYNRQQPSVFVEEFKRLGVPVLRKP